MQTTTLDAPLSSLEVLFGEFLPVWLYSQLLMIPLKLRKPMPTFNFLHLVHTPILQQLQMEEALLRADERNWIILNEGSSPAIVMGISGKQDELIHAPNWKANPLPVIRRFSGGGTVVVDRQTTFVTFIGNSQEFDIDCNPQAIMQWTETLYQPLFANHSFSLRENDYVLGEKKCGGNAQYLCKNRYLHHTSFLWDYSPTHMQTLSIPTKMPTYRNKRSHTEFLCKIKDYFSSREVFHSNLIKTIEEKYILQKINPQLAEEILRRPHRQATHLVKISY
jgi:lipoate-protein ligase A